MKCDNSKEEAYKQTIENLQSDLRTQQNDRDKEIEDHAHAVQDLQDIIRKHTVDQLHETEQHQKLVQDLQNIISELRLENILLSEDSTDGYKPKDVPKYSTCRFKSADAIMFALKNEEDFKSLMHQTKRSSKTDFDIRQINGLVKNLLRTYHPDKMKSIGCPAEFSKKAATFLNTYKIKIQKHSSTVSDATDEESEFNF